MKHAIKLIAVFTVVVCSPTLALADSCGNHLAACKADGLNPAPCVAAYKICKRTGCFLGPHTGIQWCGLK